MEWQVIVALVVAVPIILAPVVLIWYMNIGGIYTAIKERRAAHARGRVPVKAEQP